MEEKEKLPVEGENESKEGSFFEDKIRPFFKKWGFLFTIAFIAISIVFLFGPIVIVKFKNGEGVKWSESINLISYLNGFGDGRTMDFTLIILIIGLGCAVAGHWKEEIGVLGTLFCLVGACFLILAKAFAVDYASELENFKSIEIAWGGALSIAFAVFAAGASLVPSFRKNTLTVRDIAEDGVLIAMAFGLNFLKLFAAPTGGSVNLQMLPLMLIALRHGPFHGFLCGGLIYGLLTCLTDGYGFATYPFDYLIGFGSVAVLGFFRPLIFGPNQKGYNLKGEIFLFIGGVASTALRYIGGTVSSMVVYQADLVYALWYNSIYITVSGAFAFAVIMALYGPLVRVNALFPVNRGLAKSDLK